MKRRSLLGLLASLPLALKAAGVKDTPALPADVDAPKVEPQVFRYGDGGDVFMVASEEDRMRWNEAYTQLSKRSK